MPKLIYFPYLNLKNEDKITFGDVEIWNFDKLINEKIPDEATRNHVISLIQTNKDRDGKHSNTIKDIGVVSIGKTDFREYNAYENGLIQDIKLVLFLSKIAKTNTTILGSSADGWSLSTSENFEPVFQNFEIGNDHISERAGVIAPIGIGGYQLGEKVFYKPSHVLLSPFGLSLDKELFNQLFQLKNHQKKLYRRILRATELMFQSYYNSPNVSYNSRILLSAAAFETLLNLEVNQARRDFKERIEKYCDRPNEQKYRCYYYSFNKKRGKQVAKRDKNRSIKVFWADSFFELRNQIIHGDKVETDMFFYKGQDRHHDIAILFFCLLIKQLINEKLSKPAFADYIDYKMPDDAAVGFHYEDRSVSLALAKIISKAYAEQQKKR